MNSDLRTQIQLLEFHRGRAHILKWVFPILLWALKLSNWFLKILLLQIQFPITARGRCYPFCRNFQFTWVYSPVLLQLRIWVFSRVKFNELALIEIKFCIAFDLSIKYNSDCNWIWINFNCCFKSALLVLPSKASKPFHQIFISVQIAFHLLYQFTCWQSIDWELENFIKTSNRINVVLCGFHRVFRSIENSAGNSVSGDGGKSWIQLQTPCTRIHGSGGAIDVVDLER